MDEDRLTDILIIGIVIAIIILKIVNVITIPWIWLLCPLWGLAAIGIVFAIFMTFLYLITRWCQNYKRRKKNETEY